MIEPFTTAYAKHFRSLNEERLEKYFHIEPHDREMLSDPFTKIIEPGGEIFFAKFDGKIVGTCALVKVDDETFEFAKMAVTESAQGLGLGRKLALAVIQQARKCGAKKLFLETNSKLSAARHLYRSVGFVETQPPFETVYERADVYMEIAL